MWTYSDFVSNPLFCDRFGDPVLFPEPLVSEHLAIAYDAEGCRWSDRAIGLLVAHRLEMMARSEPSSQDSGAQQGSGLERYITPGASVSSLSVSQGSSSVSFSGGSGEAKNRWGIGAGENLSATRWGQMLLSMRPKSFSVGMVL